jgi:hypothetical protein
MRKGIIQFLINLTYRNKNVLLVTSIRLIPFIYVKCDSVQANQIMSTIVP